MGSGLISGILPERMPEHGRTLGEKGKKGNGETEEDVSEPLLSFSVYPLPLLVENKCTARYKRHIHRLGIVRITNSPERVDKNKTSFTLSALL